MSSDVAIRVRDVTKHYVLFDRPEDRLKQMIVPRLQRLAGRPVTRYFRPFAALNNVSFDVRRGETVGIVGRNGSGKSTLLQIICGTLTPTVGSVEVNGRIAALLELGSGFNPQFTGRENVFLYAAILGLSRQEIERRFDDIARFADIGLFIDQPVKTYSSGMYVRLAFATAINVDPDILVVDEALAVGDEAFQRKCFARIEDIKGKGGTILFVSHGAQTIVQLCDRALLMDGGELILTGRPKMVVSQYQRLMNHSGAEAEQVRAAINALNGEEESQLPVPAYGHAGLPETSFEEPTHFDPALEYDPNLVSKSCVDYESQGARISGVHIEDSRGRRVNILVNGKSYRIVYDLKFDRKAKAAAFGTAIKTVSGLQVSGATTRNNSDLKNMRVSAGEELRVELEFKCFLNCGTYFINCGVRGVVEEGDIYLHRVLDAYIFKVVVQHESMATDVVDLDFQASVQKLAHRDISTESVVSPLDRFK